MFFAFLAILGVDFVSKVEDNSYLFALSWFKIKHKTKHRHGDNLSVLIHLFIKHIKKNYYREISELSHQRKWPKQLRQRNWELWWKDFNENSICVTSLCVLTKIIKTSIDPTFGQN